MTFCAGFGAENTAPESAPIKPLHSRINNMEGKIVAVTGGAQGIGFSTVDLLLSKGARVSVGDLDEAKLSSAEEHFQTAVKEARVRFQKVDVSNSKEVDSWIAETVKWGGRLDGAVNAAGINCSESGQPTLADTSDERWHLLLSVNLTGMFYCLRAEINHITDGGSIVCISSVQGLLGFPTSASYSASKFGVNGLVRSVAKETGDRNRCHRHSNGSPARSQRPQNANKADWTTGGNCSFGRLPFGQ